jgi:hypothetical protein
MRFACFVATALALNCFEALDEQQALSVRIPKLIERLAISQEKADDAPIFTPSRDAPRTDPRVIAYDAIRRLQENGATAFPFLVNHLKDHRQSVAMRRVIPHDVGDACYCIITRQLYALPDGYGGSFYRKGRDGKLHERSVFSIDLFSYFL